MELEEAQNFSPILQPTFTLLPCLVVYRGGELEGFQRDSKRYAKYLEA